MKKMLCLILSCCMLFLLTGCISGSLLEPGDVIEITTTRKYLSFDPGEEDIKWWEKEEAVSNPTIIDLIGDTMAYNTYYKLVFKFKSNVREDLRITAIKFDVVANSNCIINIVIRDEEDMFKDPILSRKFELTAHVPESIVVAGFVFNAGNELVFYNECPEEISILDYDGFSARWKLQKMQVVGDYENE